MNRLQLCLLIFLRREVCRLRVPFLSLALLFLLTVKHLLNLGTECLEIILEGLDAFVNQGRRY